MATSNIYKLIVMVIIHSVFTFKIEGIENEGKKYELVYFHNWKLLLLEDFVLYIYIYDKKDGKAVNIKLPKRETKSPLILSLTRLYPGVYATKNLCIIFVELPKSRFAANPSLSHVEHICHHAYTIIFMEKYIGFSLSFYYFNTFSPLVLASEIVDNVACCYSRLPLE